MRAMTPRMMQARADTLGLEVGTTGDADASLRGAAMAAAVAQSLVADAQQAARQMVPALRWYYPATAASAAARQRYERWRAIMAKS